MRHCRRYLFRITSWAILLAFAAGLFPAASARAQAPGPRKVFLPQVTNPQPAPQASPAGERINIPLFNGEVSYSESAVFWFGKVSPSENYTDVRVGYSETGLTVRLAVIDRRLWYDPSPAAADLTDWDAATLLISPQGGFPAYRFVAQFNEGLSDGRSKPEAVAAYRNDGSGWALQSLSFTTYPGWKGGSLNDNSDDKGWAMSFDIPFTTLGLSGPPAAVGWRMAVLVHDRDGASGSANPIQAWPNGADPDRPASWGAFTFGIPSYRADPAVTSGKVTLQNGLNGLVVKDAAAGGYTTCGGGTDYWTQWGDTNETYYQQEHPDFNVQNQSDISDYPCFSKYFITFPLAAIPPGKVILSARLTLHQFGNSDPNGAKPSFIQVLRVGSDWDESGLTWNNAPQVIQNYGGAWVDPLTQFPGWPGVARNWDVSQAVADAYRQGIPLRLAFYSADSDYHSGKYFTSSDVPSWDQAGRPALEITWGDPR